MPYTLIHHLHYDRQISNNCKSFDKKMMIDNRREYDDILSRNNVYKPEASSECDTFPIWRNLEFSGIMFSCLRLPWNLDTLPGHHVVDIVVWVMLTSYNKLVSVCRKFTGSDWEVLEVNRLKFRIFFPIYLKKRNCSVIARNLKNQKI